MALRCFRHQTWAARELIVVNDGSLHPVDPVAVREAGGRLVRATPGTPLGTKLNLGLEEARGDWCQKMDDDDWYAPDFMARMVGAVAAHRQIACRPVVAFLMPFLLFDVARWEVRRSVNNNMPGATLFFPGRLAASPVPRSPTTRISGLPRTSSLRARRLCRYRPSRRFLPSVTGTPGIGATPG